MAALVGEWRARLRIRRPSFAGAVLLASFAFGRLGIAQAPTQRTAQLTVQQSSFNLRVRVIDSAGVRIPGVDVAVLHGLGNVVGHATSDANGLAVVGGVARLDGDYDLAVRKIGYDRADRFFRVGTDSVVSLEMRLTRAVTTLPTVSVTAAEDLKRKSYHLDADAIENSDRPIFDASDLFKLRPDMLNSRGGDNACKIPFTDHDGWIESVWVNGIRVRLVTVDLSDPLLRGRRAALGLDPVKAPARRDPRKLPPDFTNSNPEPKVDTVLTILRSIHPEHIAEVTYHDCFDASIGKNGSEMAMFIALKPGIRFEPGIGSFVAESTATSDSARRANSFVVDKDLPRYRFRVLGVYDGTTGDVLDGVDVTDTSSGLSARTSVTGTVSLLFLPDGGSTVRVHKDGMRDTTFFARIAVADTVPITILLAKAP